MINTVKNAINILNCFSDDREEVGIKEFSEMLNLNNSTIHHIVKTLQTDGILVKTKNRKYRIGAKVLGWSKIVSEQYNSIYNAVPYLDELEYKTNTIVQLAVRENFHVSTLLKINADRINRVQNVIGEKIPLYCTALGKVLLSENYNDDDIRRIVFKKYTNQTIINKVEFIQELEKVKLQGFAINNMEYRKDVYCIAVPLKNRKGITVSAISLTGPTDTMMENKEKSLKMLLNSAKKISFSLYHH